MTTPGPEQADLRVVALTAKTALSSAYQAISPLAIQCVSRCVTIAGR